MVLGGGAACAGCGGNAATILGGTAPDASADGTTPAQSGGDGGATGVDGGADADDGGGGGGGGENDASVDGEVITEGGSNPITDGGDDGATLPDAGACNAIVNDATAISSTCASVAPIFGGGALAAGTYHLIAVTALGTASFCHTGFIPVGFKGSLVMTVASGVGSADSVTQLASTKEVRTSVTLTPGAGNASPLTAEDTCPAGTPSQVDYRSATNGADGGTKTLLTLRLPYGKDTADYTYEAD